MSDLKAIPAVTLEGRALSLYDVLRGWKISGQLDRLLDQTIEDAVVAEVARAEGITVSDEELQAAADSFRQTRGLQRASRTQLWLQERRLSVEDLQAFVERPLLRRKVAEHLTRDEIDRHFAENRAKFDRVRLAQIVVDKEGVAQELLSQLLDDGAEFAALARKHSLDRDSRQAGGFVGVVERRSLSPVVEAAVFGAKNGAVVGPFKTAQGWHVIRVEELLPGQLDDRTRDAIREQLFQEWVRQYLPRAKLTKPLYDLV